MKRMTPATRTVLWVSLFAIAFAFVESSVVVYLRAIYYPGGFSFPLAIISKSHLPVEVIREAATVVMLAAVGVIAGTSRWQRFGYFMLAFGLWDIFYYVWLKAVLDWPSSLTDWDILFLIPMPWIGPVIAPVLIAILMAGGGVFIVLRIERGGHFRPVLLSWTSALCATFLILFSFINDVPAALQQQLPSPYRYELLAAGILFSIAGLATACLRGRPPSSSG